MQSKLNDIKEVLAYPDLQIESEVRCDLICNFCAQIMHDACVTMCGCNYCKQCLEYSFKKGGTQCPGQKDECRKNRLVFQKNVFPDHKTNIRIGKLVAKCPNKLCDVRAELMHMKQHVVECNEKRIKSEWHEDDESVADSINSMKSDIGIIKNRYEEQLEIQMMCIEKLNREVNILKEESSRKQTKIDTLENQLQELMNDVRLLQQNSKRITDSSAIMRNDDVITKLMNAELNIKEVNERLETLVYGEFLWKIDRFSKRRKEAEYGTRRQLDSEPFYSHKNGYKMCLQLNPNGYDIGKGTHLSLFFVIMKGPFDDILKWPFKHKVRLSLLNQKTGEDHIKQEYKYALIQGGCKNSYDKPVTGNNVSLGTGQFILLDELVNNPSLIENDSIYIRCKIEPVL